MNYQGDFAVGADVFIWFNTFDSNDPSASVTVTNFTDTDVHIYKDDSLTQRVNAAGVAVDIDVDTFAGVHKITIDTADNTVNDFYEAGHDYAVVVEGITIDSGQVSACVGTFSIANRRVAGQMAVSSIEALTDQSNFTLTTGEASANNDAYNGCTVIVTDQTTKIQKAIGHISDYVGATRAIVLHAAPLQTAFTMAVGDSVEIIATAAFANVNTVGQTTQTANDNGADINTLVTEVAKVPKSDSTVTWNATALASIEAEAVDALESFNLDTFAGVDTGVAADGDLSPHVVTGSVLAHIMASDKDVTTSYNASTDALQAIRDHIGDGTNLTEAGGDGDHLTESGGTGDQLTAINLPNQTMDIVGNITGNLSGSAGSVTGAVGSVAGNVDGSVGSLTGHTNQTGDTFALANGAAGFVAIDTVVDAIKVVTDNLASSATTIVSGTVSHDNTPATTTTFFSDDITEATADHYNGRIIIFTSGAVQNQATDITDYALDTGEGKFTVTALTEAPADNVTFVIV